MLPARVPVESQRCNFTIKTLHIFCLPIVLHFARVRVALATGGYPPFERLRRSRPYDIQRNTTVSILASSLALGSADYTWRRNALCRDTDPELFFPVGTTGQALLQISRAKEVCCECPVKFDCLDFAMETNQDTGIWGGTSEEERRQMRREIAARARAARIAANNGSASHVRPEVASSNHLLGEEHEDQ